MHDKSAAQLTPSVPAPSALTTRPAARRWSGVGIAAIAVLLLAIGGTVLWRSNGNGESVGPSASTETTTPVASAVDRSFAVLPFVNLSGDPDQEFFSDGLTEEITSTLARIRDLKVVGRTSAFEFKGKNQNLRAIGQALGARYLLEGSVRKAGDQLRVTAQLINAADGVHIWTESYDRKLADVFAIQEEIATAIAGALRVPLGLKQGESLVTSRTTDIESYQDYLRAKALYSSLILGSTDQAIEVLERVVARTPEFAPAWGLLSRYYIFAPDNSVAGRSGSYDEARRERELRRAEEAAQRAVNLDPAVPDGHIALGRLHQTRGNLLAAEDAFDKALSLDPNDPDALTNQSRNLATAGRLDRALAISRRGLELEPFRPTVITNVANMSWLNGDTDAAIKLMRDVPSSTADRNTLLVKFLASQGRFREAADAMHEDPAENYLPGIRDVAERLLRSAPASVSLPQSLPKLGRLSFVYLYVGAPDRALDQAEDGFSAGVAPLPPVFSLWHPSYAPVRKTERFKVLARKMGMVDYWRALGWPTFCHPVGADDFTCS